MDKFARVERYETIRKALRKANGGPITDEQYQAEEPEYWKWYLKKKAIWQNKERATGIREGVWMNVDFLEAAPVLNEAFQVEVLDGTGLLPGKLGEAIAEDNLTRIQNRKSPALGKKKK